MACLPTCPLALQRSELLCVSIAPGSSVNAQQSNVHDKDKEQTPKNHNRKATGRGPAWTGSRAEGSFLACMFNDKSIVCCTSRIFIAGVASAVCLYAAQGAASIYTECVMTVAAAQPVLRNQMHHPD